MYYSIVFNPKHMIGRLSCVSVINLTILKIEFYYEIQNLACARLCRHNSDTNAYTS